jgi:hypothetical protein
VTNSSGRTLLRPLITAIAALLLLFTPGSTPKLPWQAYVSRGGSFVPLSSSFRITLPSPHPFVPPPPVSSDWQVTGAILADVTNDGSTEWVLLVWRPWRDWPIQRWISVPSPIAGLHDAAGNSCQIILLNPRDGREVWAGSALPTPFLSLAVGDVDGDGRTELVTLEGDYATGRDGPGSAVDVWRWNGFGFGLEWRSPASTLYKLRLTDANNDGILDIAVR